MKKRIIILAVFALVLIPLFLFAFADYQYRCINGEHTISLLFPRPRSDEATSSIQFESYDEMVKDIRFGRFTREEKRYMYWFPRNEDGRITICDIDNLLIPVMPENLTYCIYWAGEFYSCRAETDSYSVSYYFPSAEDWEKERTFYSDVSGMSLQHEDPLTGDQIYTGKRKYSEEEFCMVLRSIEDGGRTLHIIEDYIDYPKNIYAVMIFGEKDGMYYRVNINYFTYLPPVEGPSVDYLKQFDVVRYTGN